MLILITVLLLYIALKLWQIGHWVEDTNWRIRRALPTDRERDQGLVP